MHLVKYEAARKALAEANAVDEAERKLGEMLKAQKEAGLMSQGGRPSENLSSDTTSLTLAEIGVSRDLSSRAQAILAANLRAATRLYSVHQK